MAIYNGKIRTRYGEYTMSTKYKALVLLSRNVNVCKRVTDAYSSKGYIFMDCYSSLEDIRDALNINWSNNYINVILVGDSKTDYKDDSEFRKWCDKYFRYASGIYLSNGLLDSDQLENAENLIRDNPFILGEIYGWFNCASIKEEIWE